MTDSGETAGKLRQSKGYGSETDSICKHLLPHDQIKKKLGNAKEKKRQDIDTLMIAKTDVGKIQCRHDAEK